MSAKSVSRRTFLAGATAAVGASALPLPPLPVAEAALPASASAVTFSRAGVSLNGGQTIFAVYEQLADGAILVTEDAFGPGETLSFWANGLGQFFDISTPLIDDDAYVRPDEEDEDADLLDDDGFYEKYGRERWVEPSYEPASFVVEPGSAYYAAVYRAMAEADGWRFQPYPELSVEDDE